jgi:hypothetical protein
LQKRLSSWTVSTEACLATISYISCDPLFKRINFHFEFTLFFIENYSKHLLLKAINNDEISSFCIYEFCNFIFNNFLELLHIQGYLKILSIIDKTRDYSSVSRSRVFARVSLVIKIESREMNKWLDGEHSERMKILWDLKVSFSCIWP